MRASRFPHFLSGVVLGAALLLGVGPNALAQGRPGGPPPPPSGSAPSGRGGGLPPMSRPDGNNGPNNTTGAGVGVGPGAPRTNQLGDPIGRWWDDPAYVKSVGIDRAQQKRMDNVFGANRDQLQRLYTDLKREQAQLTRVSKTAGVTEQQLDGQIDRVAQARSELQKATTHMLLELRGQLSAEQVSRLEAGKP